MIIYVFDCRKYFVMEDECEVRGGLGRIRRGRASERRVAGVRARVEQQEEVPL